MWPMLLDMSKLECKKELRKLELEAYSSVVSAFRAQGDLNTRKTQALKELESLFKISADRHKAELRRALNDEKLHTIAKRLSHGECILSEWTSQSRRLIPLLPRLQQTTSSSAAYYRILADHILKSAQPVLKLYAEPEMTKKMCSSESENNNERDEAGESYKNDLVIMRKKTRTKKKMSRNEETNDKLNKNKLKVAQKNQDILFLNNGYAVCAKHVEVQNSSPSELLKSSESYEKNGTFLKYLIQKYKSQKNVDKRDAKRDETSSPTRVQVGSPNASQQCLNESPATPAPLLTTPTPVEKKSEPTKPTTEKSSNKSSKLISQMIEANANKTAYSPILTPAANPSPHTTNETHTSPSLKPAGPIKISSTQILRLNQQSNQTLLSTTPLTSAHNSTNQLVQTLNSNNPQSSTIVKLTSPSPITLNSIGSLNKTPAPPFPLFNPNGQQLKHLVQLPKSAQKLIILPSSNHNHPPPANNLITNVTNLKPNFILSNGGNNNVTQTSFSQTASLSPIIIENGDSNNPGQVRIVSSSLLNQNNYAQLNPLLQPSPIHKLILYKPPSTPIDSAHQSSKSLKIVSTTPILSNSNKQFLLNTKPTTILHTLRQEEFKAEEQAKLFELVVSTEQQQQQQQQSTTDSCNSLKRKRSLSSSENSPVFKEVDNNSDSPSSLSSSSSTLSISPPNWTEKNLQFIKEMLDKLNESDGEYCHPNNNQQLPIQIEAGPQQQQQQQQEQKRALRILCETIKEKLEKNVYECVDELNNDLKIVKERCVGNEENEASSKRVKLLNFGEAAGLTYKSLLPAAQTK